MKPYVDAERWEAVRAKLEIQESDARWWRDACVQYFMEFSGMPVPSDVAQPERPLEELKKITGKVWEETTLRGYSQGDWQTLYYVVDEVTKEEIETIENFYMSKVTEFVIDESGDGEDVYHDFIPDDVVWGGKKSICDYFGFKVEDTTVYEDDGYMKVYKYKEIV